MNRFVRTIGIVFLGFCLLGGCFSTKTTPERQQAKADAVVVAPEFTRPVVLPAPINTDKWEDSPRISPDGSRLYFCRTSKISLFRLFLPILQDFDLYEAWRGDEGYEVRRMGCSIPDEFSLDGAGYSRDGKTLYFNAVRKDTVGGTDIYVSTLKDGVWTRGTNIGPPINTKAHEAEPHISTDGKTMYFASTRKDGYGKADIWFSRLGEDGNWTEPVNVGPPINTEREEHQAFLTPDQSTMYYTSGKSMRGHDGPAIFRSHRKPDGTWEKPTEVISNFCGEPSLTDDGQYLYFLHVTFKLPPSRMESDIMFVRRR